MQCQQKRSRPRLILQDYFELRSTLWYPISRKASQCTSHYSMVLSVLPWNMHHITALWSYRCCHGTCITLLLHGLIGAAMEHPAPWSYQCCHGTCITLLLHGLIGAAMEHACMPEAESDYPILHVAINCGHMWNQ